MRKRLTLATELVAKPSLLFLDEPTSGLDGQSAFEICRFMRKLAASGQTIICTIHQPSATLFEAFDVLLLLAKGGRTTYFGETGQNSHILLDYFARNGAPCPEDANPAEHIVDVVQGRQGDGTDWPQQWLASPEYQHTMEELKKINLDQAKDAALTNVEEPEDTADFATPLKHQLILVTKRQLVALWRNPDYIWNKIGLHVTNSLFAGFTFWMIGNGTFDLQFRLMSVFNFVFVAPGCINQNQPLFLRNRDIFESREKKSKMVKKSHYMIGHSKATANFCANSVSLGSLRHRTDCLRIPIPDRLRAPVLCLLVLCSRAEYLRILCGQCFLRYCKSLISARESFHDALLTRAIPGDVRVPIHSHRTIDRSLHAQRRLRVTHQPACHRDPGLLLRCCDSLQPD